MPLKRINSSLFAHATVLVAFFLRVYRLADKNIWWDEGWSLWLARQDFAAIALRTASDEHPPLHYWMLRVWDSLAGWDAFVARFLSVAFGVLTIALVYRLGKRVGGAWVGLLAALFIAVARFHVWWSQDIKNYTPSIFFAFAAVWFGMSLVARSKKEKQGWKLEVGAWSLVVAYAVCAALAMLTHYLAALVLLALNLYALIVFARRSISRFAFFVWVLSNALAAILFAPWLVLYLQKAQAWSAAPTFDFGLFIKLVATALPLGVTTNIEDYAGLTIAFTTLAALGMTFAIARSRKAATKQSQSYKDIASLPEFASSKAEGDARHNILLFTIILLLPPVLIYVLSLTPVSFFAPKIQARYLLILYPAYAILIALGIMALQRFSIYLAYAATLFILVASALVLRDYYAERRLTDEYATLANTINAFARQGDLVLLDTDQEWPTILYYLRAPLGWLGAPNGKAMTESDADLLVRRATNRYSAAWVVAIPDALATDPRKLVEARLERDWQKQFERTFSDKRLTLYAPAPRDMTNVARENFAPQFPSIERLSDTLTLLGYDLPTREAFPGDVVRLVTYWNAAAASEVGVTLGIVSATEKLGTGERVRVETDLLLPPSAMGEFPLKVNQIELARIRVERRRTPAGGDSLQYQTDYRFAEGIRLVGYQLPITIYHTGDSVPLTLYWRAEQPIAKNYWVFVHLLGKEFNAAQNNFLWGQVDRAPRDGAFPTTAWRPNETVSDPYRVPIAPNVPAGKYKIEVGMYDAVTGARLRLSDGSDSVIVAEIEIVR